VADGDLPAADAFWDLGVPFDIARPAQRLAL
jgi:hypothetical protein